MTPTLRELTVAALTAAVAVVGTYFQFKGQIEEANTSQMSVIFSRIGELEAQVQALNEMNSAQTAELVSLEAENTRLTVKLGLLQAKLSQEGPGVTAVFELLDDLKVPGWCKEWVGSDPDREGHFVMAHINAAYEFTYNVTRDRYVGSTDFDVHPVRVAKAFNENDLRTYSTRGWIDFREPIITADGREEIRRFWKFYHDIEDGPELVCGWEVP